MIEGKGKTEIGGQTFDWEQNDIMVVPNFVWRKHINTGTSDAIIYTVSDSALLALDRPVPRAGQGQGRQGDPAGAVGRTPHAINTKAPP